MNQECEKDVQIEQLKDKVYSTKKKQKELQTQVVSLRQKNLQLEEQKAELNFKSQQEISDLNKKLHELRLVKIALEQVNEEQQRSFEDKMCQQQQLFEKKFEQQQKTVEQASQEDQQTLEQKLNEAMESYQMLAEEYQNLKSQQEEIQELNKQLQEDCELKDEALEQYEKSISQIEDIQKRAKQEHDRLKKDRDDYKKQSEIYFNDHIPALQNKIEELCENLSNQQKDFEKVKQKKKQLDQDKKELLRKFEEMTRIRQNETEMFQKDSDGLKKQVEQKDKKIKFMQQEADTFIQVLRNKLETIIEEKVKSPEDLSILPKLCQYKSVEIRQFSDVYLIIEELKNLKKEKDQINKDENKQIKQLNNEINNLKKKSENLQDLLQKNESDYQIFIDQLFENLQGIPLNVQYTINQLDEQAIHAMIDTIKTQFMKLNKDFQYQLSQNNVLQELKSRVDLVEISKVKEHEILKRSLEEETEILKQEYQNKLNVQQRSFKESQGQVSKLQQELDQVHNLLKSKSNQIDSLNNSNQNFKQSINELENQILVFKKEQIHHNHMKIQKSLIATIQKHNEAYLINARKAILYLKDKFQNQNNLETQITEYLSVSNSQQELDATPSSQNKVSQKELIHQQFAKIQIDRLEHNQKFIIKRVQTLQNKLKFRQVVIAVIALNRFKFCLRQSQGKVKTETIYDFKFINQLQLGLNELIEEQYNIDISQQISIQKQQIKQALNENQKQSLQDSQNKPILEQNELKVLQTLNINLLLAEQRGQTIMKILSPLEQFNSSYFDLESSLNTWFQYSDQLINQFKEAKYQYEINLQKIQQISIQKEKLQIELQVSLKESKQLDVKLSSTIDKYKQKKEAFKALKLEFSQTIPLEEFQFLKQKFEQVSKENLELRQKNNEKLDKQKDLQGQLDQLLQKLQYLEEENKKEKEDNFNDYQENQDCIESLREEINSKNELISELETRIGLLEGQHSEQLAEYLKKLQKCLEEQSNSLQTIDQLSQEIQDLKNLKSDLEDKLLRVSQENMLLRKVNQEIKQQVVLIEEKINEEEAKREQVVKSQQNQEVQLRQEHMEEIRMLQIQIESLRRESQEKLEYFQRNLEESKIIQQDSPKSQVSSKQQMAGKIVRRSTSRSSLNQTNQRMPPLPQNEVSQHWSSISLDQN